jgi:predicted transcriptional regulator
MKPDMRKPQTEKIWKMTLAGMTAPAIAQELGVKFALVNSAVRRGRENGVVPRRKRKNPLKHGTKNHMRLGSISYIIKQLSEEQLDWLVINAHKCECETVSEYILEIVRDAFFEEVAVNKNEQA